MTASFTIYVQITLLFLFTAISSKYCIESTVRLLHSAGSTLSNYRGREVVLGAGIAFLPIIYINSALALYFFSDCYSIYMGLFFLCSTIGFAGILDDMLGEKEIKGLRNHIKSFFKGQLTTGFVKAFMGMLAALIASYSISKEIYVLLLNAFIIALFTNAMNLMDLRPGRCTKTFLLIGLPIFLFHMRDVRNMLPLGITWLAGFIYLPYDLKEQCMLGDSGANMLGATLGYFFAISSTISIKLIVLMILLFVNVAAERVSFSAIISKSKLLHYIDNLGRSS